MQCCRAPTNKRISLLFQAIKILLILAFAAIGALAKPAPSINEVEFTLGGKKYTETVIGSEDSRIVVVPKQGRADHTMILHDFQNVSIRQLFANPLTTINAKLGPFVPSCAGNIEQ